ncbi:MAG: glycosyltransferase [Pseudomonadota bacterium]
MGAIWTPLPPSPSGIANYAATLFGEGEEFADDVFVSIRPEERENPRAVGPEDATEDHALLQIGNNAHHSYVYERAMKGGAVVEMHDLSLHHLHTELTLAKGDFHGYRNGLEASHGEMGRRLAYQRQKGFYAPNLEFHARVNKAVTDRASAVIVHSRWARMQLEMQDCAAPIYVVPHYAPSVEASPGRAADKTEARRLTGLPEDAFVILSAGYVTRAKKVEWTIAAFERIAGDAPEAMLVIAGACGYDAVKRMIDASPFRHRIRVTGYLSDEAFCDYTLASDIIPVMRFPSAGESSGVAARALGFGRLVVAPELMAFSDLDDAHCEKITLESDPVPQLAAVLRKWRGDPQGLAAKEAAIRAYAADALAPEVLRKELAAIVKWHWT